MSILKDGKEYFTPAETAKELSASVQTLKRWIREGKLPDTIRIQQGTQQVRVFDATYIEAAKIKIKNSFK